MGRGSGPGGVRVDVNEELKYLGKFMKEKNSEGGGSSGRVGLVGGGGGVRVDVNAMLGVGG